MSSREREDGFASQARDRMWLHKAGLPARGGCHNRSFAEGHCISVDPICPAIVQEM